MGILTTASNVLLIILGFGVLIFIHELGHFIAAKWAGIRTEAFAVGMGPVAISWRKGIGLRFGSTAREYEKRVRDFLESDTTHSASVLQHKTAAEHESNPQANSQLPPAELYRIGDKLGLGETEYSLRWLPIGGFVKMLGQEDANPNYVSDDPRSYNRCPVFNRMIVVSAGVIMNVILALVLFVVAFMAGVQFDAPVVGAVADNMPAGQTAASNAAELGLGTIGLQPGDEVVTIDGKPARTFADLQIASAMSKPGVPIHIEVRRSGYEELLTFKLLPQHDPASGLLGIGIAPGASTTLIEHDDANLLKPLLKRTGLDKVGVEPGMRLLTVNDQPISTYGQLERAADDSQGELLGTTWAHVDHEGKPVGDVVHAALETSPTLMEFPQKQTSADLGLVGLTPLTRVTGVTEKSDNAGVLQPGDVFIKLADVPYPRRSQIFETLKANKRSTITAIVLRNGKEVPLSLKVNRDGMLQIEIEYADNLLITAQPIDTYLRYRSDDPSKTEEVATPIKAAHLFTTGGTRVLTVGERPVATWGDFRQALRAESATAFVKNADATVKLGIEHPNAGHDYEIESIVISADEVKKLHQLGWQVDLPGAIFEPIETTLTAHGNPLVAISMGLNETKKLITLTYLTIDRLVRGSVGVEQLRGPVGIIHIGTKIATKGFMYTIFFLGMISVNLAVINFLPIPIVDGGLFLFLVYEKFKGRPPSLAFQNAATIVGLALIGTIFLVTFYNDVLRLLS